MFWLKRWSSDLVEGYFDLKDEVLDLLIVELGRLRVEIRCWSQIIAKKT